MMVWGVISAATASVTNFGGLIAVRFFLGFVEAAYFVSTRGACNPGSEDVTNCHIDGLSILLKLLVVCLHSL